MAASKYRLCGIIVSVTVSPSRYNVVLLVY
jgi:hypothetical protein